MYQKFLSIFKDCFIPIIYYVSTIFDTITIKKYNNRPTTYTEYYNKRYLEEYIEKYGSL